MHDDCSFHDEVCEVDPATCRHEAARQRRKREKQGGWSRLELRRDDGGLRHYLDGEAVHCGRGIELQAVEEKHDDYGEYSVPLQRGVVVRYEASLNRVEQLHRIASKQLDADELARRGVTLYTDVAGHEAVITFEAWLRFRWPVRS